MESVFRHPKISCISVSHTIYAHHYYHYHGKPARVHNRQISKQVDNLCSSKLMSLSKVLERISTSSSSSGIYQAQPPWLATQNNHLTETCKKIQTKHGIKLGRTMNDSKTTLHSLIPYLRPLPAGFLSLQLLTGGLIRLIFPLPRFFPQIFHDAQSFVFTKSEQTAPTLYPLIPFRGTTPQSVTWHIRYVGFWMTLTGGLLASPGWKGRRETLGLGLFCLGTIFWSHLKVGDTLVLPAVNMGLAWLNYYLG